MITRAQQIRTAFIVPFGVDKALGADGWTFSGSGRIPELVRERLVEQLQLSYHEAYLGVEVYAGDLIKVTVIYDESRAIEILYLEIDGGFLESFRKIFDSSSLSDVAELFIPSDGSWSEELE